MGFIESVLEQGGGNATELNDLSDVTISSVTNEDVLLYNNQSHKFQNSQDYAQFKSSVEEVGCKNLLYFDTFNTYTKTDDNGYTIQPDAFTGKVKISGPAESDFRFIEMGTPYNIAHNSGLDYGDVLIFSTKTTSSNNEVHFGIYYKNEYTIVNGPDSMVSVNVTNMYDSEFTSAKYGIIVNADHSAFSNLNIYPMIRLSTFTSKAYQQPSFNNFALTRKVKDVELQSCKNIVELVVHNPADNYIWEGDSFILNGKRRKCTADIVPGDTITSSNSIELPIDQDTTHFAHKIVKEGNSFLPVTSRPKLQFNGAYTHDDSTYEITKVDIVREFNSVSDIENLTGEEAKGFQYLDDDVYDDFTAGDIGFDNSDTSFVGTNVQDVLEEVYNKIDWTLLGNFKFADSGTSYDGDWNLTNNVPTRCNEICFYITIGGGDVGYMPRNSMVIPYSVFSTYKVYYDFNIGTSRVYLQVERVSDSKFKITNVTLGGLTSPMNIYAYAR